MEIKVVNYIFCLKKFTALVITCMHKTEVYSIESPFACITAWILFLKHILIRRSLFMLIIIPLGDSFQWVLGIVDMLVGAFLNGKPYVIINHKVYIWRVRSSNARMIIKCSTSIPVTCRLCEKKHSVTHTCSLAFSRCHHPRFTTVPNNTM